MFHTTKLEITNILSLAQSLHFLSLTLPSSYIYTFLYSAENQHLQIYLAVSFLFWFAGAVYPGPSCCNWLLQYKTVITSLNTSRCTLPVRYLSQDLVEQTRDKIQSCIRQVLIKIIPIGGSHCSVSGWCVNKVRKGFSITLSIELSCNSSSRLCWCLL